VGGSEVFKKISKKKKRKGRDEVYHLKQRMEKIIRPEKERTPPKKSVGKEGALKRGLSRENSEKCVSENRPRPRAEKRGEGEIPHLREKKGIRRVLLCEG